jgi:lipopolysaccharide transport system ATP-binding protein
MVDTAISVENLSKSYLVGHQNAKREGYTALRDVIAREARNFVRNAAHMARGQQIVQGDEFEEFWALKNVSFKVERGDVIGIIGRNGAGKSTLLKILSRITEPTEGRVRIRGRVASLLEVGTGFHPELTGRENIYLNGAILGMSRAEIRRKFDEIVSFAEVEKFLDTPVKRYSSGMYVRLAFAVAAHLEPDIFVVDEVLAVGDSEFQKKCLGKLSDVAGHGRTVLFVSHNMDAIRRICISGLYLANGSVLTAGTIDECIKRYMSDTVLFSKGNTIEFKKRSMDKPHLVRIEILDSVDRPLPMPMTWSFVKFRIYYYSPIHIKDGSVELYISTASGDILTRCSTRPDSAYSMPIMQGEHYVDCEFSNLLLSAGMFVLGAGLAVPNVEWLDNQPHGGVFNVEGRDVFNSGFAPTSSRYPIPMVHTWSIPGARKLATV